MGDPIAEVEPAPVSFDIWFARQRVLRTILQVVVGLLLAIAAFVASVAAFAPEIIAELRDVLPASVYGWLVGFIAVCAAISGALSKLMAIPGVNRWLSEHSPFGSAPRAAVKSSTTITRDDDGIPLFHSIE